MSTVLYSLLGELCDCIFSSFLTVGVILLAAAVTAEPISQTKSDSNAKSKQNKMSLQAPAESGHFSLRTRSKESSFYQVANGSNWNWELEIYEVKE